MDAVPAAIDYLNPAVPRALPWHELELVEATPESLAGYGMLVDDPQDFPVEIVTWPKPAGPPGGPGHRQRGRHRDRRVLILVGG